jgi:hypothetical protein
MLDYIFSPILKRNGQFKSRHAGETCYIFGNGASINNMDIREFANHPSIGVNFLSLHNNFRDLNLLYYVITATFFFYPWRKNSYINKYQKNILGDLLKLSLSQHSDIPMFTSISNILGWRQKNVFYLHHFGNRVPDHTKMNIENEFSFMKGALYTGLGLAIELGFKKAILVGCDYLYSPSNTGHFYSNDSSTKVERNKNIFADLFKAVEGLIETTVITDGGMSPWLPSQTYEQFTGKKIHYKKNTDIVKPEYLDMMEKAIIQQQYRGKLQGEKSC